LLLGCGQGVFIDVLHVYLEWKAGCTAHTHARMLVLSTVLALFAPVDRVASLGIRRTLRLSARVNTLRNVNQGLLTSTAPHVRFRDQLIIILRGPLTHWHFLLREFVRVSRVFTVALFAESVVITLLAIEAECALFDRL